MKNTRRKSGHNWGKASYPQKKRSLITTLKLKKHHIRDKSLLYIYELFLSVIAYDSQNKGLIMNIDPPQQNNCCQILKNEIQRNHTSKNKLWGLASLLGSGLATIGFTAVACKNTLTTSAIALNTGVCTTSFCVMVTGKCIYDRTISCCRTRGYCVAPTSNDNGETISISGRDDAGFEPSGDRNALPPSYSSLGLNFSGYNDDDTESISDSVVTNQPDSSITQQVSLLMV